METSATSPDFDPSLIPDEPPRWPAVVGTISIIWAVLGFGCGALFVGKILFFPGDPNVNPPTNMTPLFLLVVGGGFLLGFLLLAAGVAGVMRRPGTRGLHLAYAVLGLLLMIPGVLQQMQANADMVSWAQNHPDTDFGKMMAGAFAGYMLPISLGCYGLVALPYPLFCLVWFGLVKRRAAEIRPLVT
ncbi:MAG: hypothetical protein IT437_13495 [Phycisphaerales bacterium]|nr:hypothetical protein [Phycisphaerales bacterium]